MTQYASITDLTNIGLPATALGQLSNTQLTAALQAASDLIDAYFNVRYTLPLLAWSTDVTLHCCWIAAYIALTTRGYNPASGADINLRERYDDSIKWLGEIQRQALSPVVVQSPDPMGTHIQPFVTSQSVIFTATGQIARLRGW